MCAAAAIGPAIGAVTSAMSMSAANKEKRANYAHALKVRERKWMQDRTTYKTKKVQFEEEVDLANIAAQRAYSRTQRQLHNARSLAILENQEDFKKMLANEGNIEVSAAERGVRGKSVTRQLVLNGQNFGLSQALRTRGLTEAGYKAKMSNEDVNRELKSRINRAYGGLVIQPRPDMEPVKPVMQNPGMALMIGLGGAALTGIASNENLRKKWFSKKDGGSSSGGTSYSNTPGVTQDYTPPSTIDYGPSYPEGSFGIGSTAQDRYFSPSSNYGIQRFTYGM